MIKRFCLALVLNFYLVIQADAKTLYRISVLNIGEGDSILIEDTINHEAILVDSGTSAGSDKIISELKKRKINKLNSIIISHPHLDHIGGISSLVHYLKPDKYYDNGEDLEAISKTDPIYHNYLEFIRSSNYKALKEGEIINFRDLNLKVLSSKDSIISNDWNTNSLVMLLTYKKFKMLLMGDGNLETEKYLTNKYCKEIHASVLKAGHHGATDTASDSFLECVKPKFIAISVNNNNLLGSPALQTIRKYKAISMRLFVTKDDGDIEVELFDNKEFNIRGAGNGHKD